MLRGQLLLTGDERADLEQQEVLRERQHTEQERQKRQQLVEKL